MLLIITQSIRLTYVEDRNFTRMKKKWYVNANQGDAVLFSRKGIQEIPIKVYQNRLSFILSSQGGRLLEKVVFHE